VSRTFTLGERFEAFVDERVASGRDADASDVVRAALRLLEEHQRLAVARREGEASGEPRPLDFEQLKIEGRHRLDAERPR
jgi:antitoxin ParD1/3/4